MYVLSVNKAMHTSCVTERGSQVPGGIAAPTTVVQLATVLPLLLAAKLLRARPLNTVGLNSEKRCTGS